MPAIAPAQPMAPGLRAVPQAIPAAAVPEPYRFTVAQYERMSREGILTEADRVELINGIVVTKMAKGPAHVWSCKRAGDRLEPMLGPGFCLRREAPARIPDLNEPEPDLAVARGEEVTYLTRHPDAPDIAMVVEVSDTTYRYDRHQKLPAYALGRIPIYWIVHLARRCVEVYTQPGDQGYASQRDYQAGDTISVVIDGQPMGELAVDDILPPLTDTQPPDPAAP